MIERKRNGITPLCASGKKKYISGGADFGTPARHGHGFHTRPNLDFISISLFVGCLSFILSSILPLRFDPHGGHQTGIPEYQGLRGLV